MGWFWNRNLLELYRTNASLKRRQPRLCRNHSQKTPTLHFWRNRWNDRHFIPRVLPDSTSLASYGRGGKGYERWCRFDRKRDGKHGLRPNWSPIRYKRYHGRLDDNFLLFVALLFLHDIQGQNPRQLRNLHWWVQKVDQHGRSETW